jgi:hypothetical protein
MHNPPPGPSRRGAPMRESSRRWGRAPAWLWAISFALLGLSMAVAALAVRAPALLRQPFVDEQPLQRDQVPLDRAVREQVLEVLSVAGEAPLSPARLTQILRPWGNGYLGVFFLDLVDRGEAEPSVQLDLSLAVGLHWINIHYVGALEMTDGEITQLSPIELVVSGWTVPTDAEALQVLANERLAAARAHDRELDLNLARVGRLTVRNGRFWLTLPSAAPPAPR